MAYRVRFYMDMNAREAMHVIELRTAPQGHPSYRRVCQLMHRAIADVAGHRAIADAMQFVDHSEVELERLQSERNLEKKRADGRVLVLVLGASNASTRRGTSATRTTSSDRRTARRRGDRFRAG